MLHVDSCCTEGYDWGMIPSRCVFFRTMRDVLLGPPDRFYPSLHWSPTTFILKTRCRSFSFIIILGKTSRFSVIFYGDFAQQNDYDDFAQLLTFNFLGRQI